MTNFGKAAGIGLAVSLSILMLMSASGIVLAMPIPGPFTVEVPEAEVDNLSMYGGTYEHENQPDEIAPVVVQEMNTLGAPEGQTITKTMDVAGTDVTVTIDFGSATISEVLMKARSVFSGSGSLYGVEMETQTDDEGGILQNVESGTLCDLVADVFFLSVGSLSYSDLEISVNPEIVHE